MSHSGLQVLGVCKTFSEQETLRENESDSEKEISEPGEVITESLSH